MIITAEQRADIIRAALFKLLPGGWLPPVVAEKDGEVQLSWTVGETRWFVLRVGERGVVDFSGRIGGEAEFEGYSMLNFSNPAALENSLRSIAGYIAEIYRDPPAD